MTKRTEKAIMNSWLELDDLEKDLVARVEKDIGILTPADIRTIVISHRTQLVLDERNREINQSIMDSVMEPPSGGPW